eukprot:963073_1
MDQRLMVLIMHALEHVDHKSRMSHKCLCFLCLNKYHLICFLFVPHCPSTIISEYRCNIAIHIPFYHTFPRAISSAPSFPSASFSSPVHCCNWQMIVFTKSTDSLFDRYEYGNQCV